MIWTKIILGQEQNPNSILIKQETLLSERFWNEFEQYQEYLERDSSSNKWENERCMIM